MTGTFSINDTIGAIATPPGEGGIAVIRISGSETLKIVSGLFFKNKVLSKHVNPEELNSHTVHFGYFAEGSELIDECLLTVFKAPNSYTGEDVAEISCHGGSYIASKVLKAILKHGARMAMSGEFTKRAFLNGKLDLSQAEAVSDLIRSRTEEAHRSSLKQLEGELSLFVREARAELVRITSLVELELDFAEEGLEFVSREEIGNMIELLTEKMKRITESYVTGKVIREGVSLVIAGRPNSGKSSLFNKLLDRNRAIVSSTAGTTRDYLEENIIINGVLFKLTDTAGIRQSADDLEHEGIQRSFQRIEEADMAIYLIDSQLPADEALTELEYSRAKLKELIHIVAVSKCDLADSQLPDNFVRISVNDESTLEELRKSMASKAMKGKDRFKSGEIILTNLRHKLCLEHVISSLEDSRSTLEQGLSGEFISVDLRSAMNHLGEITGEITNDEILNNIFGKFCIGK